MSDQTPPPIPKPGSLRDRIAAFENKGGQTPPTSTGPPPPRPKPGGLQWKPKPPSPPTSPDRAQSDDRKPPTAGGMSASDAMESIGRGVSLKERMAALQGKGAFGGPPPVAPKPNVDRPKWKPPPAVPTVSTEDEPKEVIARVDASLRGASRSPPPRAGASPPPENQETLHREDDPVVQEADGGDPDPEEEERQRRAAIAARMARLGGARFGMGPPGIFAPKPVIRKAEPAPTAPADQPTVVKDSSQALSPPPPDLPVSEPPTPEVAAETERRDEPEAASPPVPVPTRAPNSMPVPSGPRRAAPPRKKPLKTIPTAPLPEPPAEEAGDVAVQPPAEPPVYGASLTTGDSQMDVGDVAAAVEVTGDKHLHAAADPAPTEAFHESAGQEAEEDFVENTNDHVEEESMHTAADNQEVHPDQPPEVAEAEEEDDEARRQRVAARLAQMGAFNPLAGPPPVPRRPSLDEPATEPLDVEDEVNVDTEEYGETIPPPPIPARHESVQSIEHDAAEAHIEAGQDDAKDEDDQASVPAHRDGIHAVASYTEEQGGGHDGHTLSLPEHSEEQPVEYECDSVDALAGQERGTALTQEAEAVTAPGTGAVAEVTEGSGRSQEVTNDLVAPSIATSETGQNTFKEQPVAEDEMPPPRINRPIPPPPVNLRSKPTSPSSPPLSPPPKPPLQGLRAEEEERPASPDVPPRPVPPPGRSGSMAEDAPSPPPRRPTLPPSRRTSIPATDSRPQAPASPPPVPTSARPVSRKRETLPIITTLVVQEPTVSEERQTDHVAEDGEATENVTPQPEGPGDEGSARRHEIAERMARLSGIGFRAPPAMNPLARPPLPAAPPPTSIPPDEIESEGKGEEGPRDEGDEDEAARKRRIAAKLAGTDGVWLGMLPPAAGLSPPPVRRPVSKQEDSESEDAIPPVPVPAPPQRLPPIRKPPPPIDLPAAQVEESDKTGSGSRGTSDDGVKIEAEESEMEEVHYSDAEAPLASEEEGAPALPPSRRTTYTSPRSAEALPTPPPRMTSRSPPPGRPPIPMIPAVLLGRRPSTMTGGSSSRQPSMDESVSSEAPTSPGRVSESAIRPPSEYVIVEAEDPGEGDTPVPPSHRKPSRGPGRSAVGPLPPPPPPSAIDPPDTLTSSTQWELPSIPQVVEFGEGSEMTLSGWSDDSTAVHVPPPAAPPYPSSQRTVSGKTGLQSTTSVSVSVAGSSAVRQGADLPPQLTTDELLAISGKVGVRVVEAATTLFEKSKRALVGDGSYAGFVRAVLAQVPGVTAHGASGGDDGWGYLVYAQTGNAVQRRVSDILPGDVVVFWDAKLKGHKGLHAYSQTVGAASGGGAGGGEGGRVLVGIASEFDPKKSKVRVWQANQRVGQQTVENVSYRLEDLKSGQVKVYRVLET